MSFRRDGKIEHRDERDWDAWKRSNADLLSACGLPPGVLRSHRDWNYLLDNGYWCEEYYGKHVGNIEFDLDELTPDQNEAFRQLLHRTLSDEDKRLGCAAWHHVCPPNQA
jgi:hypothetical protein